MLNGAMEKPERVAIFIDGSNFYFKLKSLFKRRNLYDFEYAALSEFLAQKRQLMKAQYYIGVVRAKPNDKKGQEMRRNQQRLFAALRTQGYAIQQGYLLQNNGVYHEKGVDVRLALDIALGAVKDEYDTALVISSDTDLIPAISEARKAGKMVEYIGFSHAPSFGLIKHCDQSRLLNALDLESFFKPQRKGAR